MVFTVDIGNIGCQYWYVISVMSAILIRY